MVCVVAYIRVKFWWSYIVCGIDSIHYVPCNVITKVTLCWADVATAVCFIKPIAGALGPAMTIDAAVNKWSTREDQSFIHKYILNQRPGTNEMYS